MNEHKIERKQKIPSRARDAERGQAIVLMALMMVVLLAMVGLAIDGGGLYFKWRDLQNATDAAALAASYARCTGGDIVEAGVRAADDNGFDNRGADGSRDQNIVQVFNPPSPDAPAETQGDNHFVEVRIWAEKPAYFIDIVYKDPLELENSAIGFCVERFDPSTLSAIMSLGGECSNDMKISIAEVEIVGGIHSEGNIQISACGQTCTVHDGASAVQGIDPSNKVDYTDGSNGSADSMGNSVLPYTVQQFQPGGKYWNMVPSSLRHYISGDDNPKPAGWSNAGGGTWKPNNADVGGALRGLYYVKGNVQIGTGVNWNTTDGVTIVATGTIDVNTGPGSDMKHYYPAGTEYPGIILFSGAKSANCGENVLQFSGSSMSVYGVLLAPEGACTTSLANTYIYGAVICYNMDLGGSWGYIEYVPDLLPPIQPNVSIAK